MESKDLMKKQNIISDITNIRVERILDAKQSRVLTSPWMRRLLGCIALVSSIYYLATLLIPNPYTISKTKRVYADYDLLEKDWLYGFRDTTQGIALVLLIWSFILLRVSMRRVTSLPDQSLDELQITNRNWAYQTGSLVGRRLGLGVALLVGLIATFGQQFSGFTGGNGPTPKAFRALERYVADLSFQNPFGFYFKFFLLLALIAYSFPMILLAWREARFPEAISKVKDDAELSPNASAANFYFQSLKWVVISMAVFLSVVLIPKVFITLGNFAFLLIIPLIYLSIPGALFLFVWASVRTAKTIMSVRKAGFTSDQQRKWANYSTIFLIFTLAAGLVVGTIIFATLARLWGETAGIPYFEIALICGVLMIPAQMISMMFFAKLETK